MPLTAMDTPTKNGQTATILLVDDEDDILDLLEYNLRRDGFKILTARDGLQALEQAQQHLPDLIVLDIMMPRLDGRETCRRLRQDPRLRHIPILMLTALSGEEDHIEGLDAGADGYLPKTSAIGVIVSQAKALLRGIERLEQPPTLLAIHDLEIDRDRYLVFRQEAGAREELRFPRKEFELLHFLASYPGKVFSRQELLDRVWGPDVYVVDRTVDVHVRKIREKLGSQYIETVKGVGYKFSE